MSETLEIQFLVSSNKLKMKDVPTFKVGLKISNTGSRNSKVDLSNSALYVNEIKSVAWDLAVQNGTIINLEILTKQSKTVEWPLGEALFNTPGLYELELRWNSIVKKQKVFISD